MQSFSDLTNGFEMKKGRPTTRRNYWVDLCAKLTNKRFGRMLGELKGIPDDGIEFMYTRAVQWKTNPKALFNKLLRENRARKNN